MMIAVPIKKRMTSRALQMMEAPLERLKTPAIWSSKVVMLLQDTKRWSALCPKPFGKGLCMPSMPAVTLKILCCLQILLKLLPRNTFIAASSSGDKCPYYWVKGCLKTAVTQCFCRSVLLASWLCSPGWTLPSFNVQQIHPPR